MADEAVDRVRGPSCRSFDSLGLVVSAVPLCSFGGNAMNQSPDLPFLDNAPKRRLFPPKRGVTYRCSSCECTWERASTCWLCGAGGQTLTPLASLKMSRALHPAEDEQAVSA